MFILGKEATAIYEKYVVRERNEQTLGRLKVVIIWQDDFLFFGNTENQKAKYLQAVLEYLKDKKSIITDKIRCLYQSKVPFEDTNTAKEIQAEIILTNFDFVWISQSEHGRKLSHGKRSTLTGLIQSS